MQEIYEMKGGPFGPGDCARVGYRSEHGAAVSDLTGRNAAPTTASASSKLDAYAGYIDRRPGEGLENRVVLHRELRERGYEGAIRL